MTNTAMGITAAPGGTGIKIALWIAQGLLALAFGFFGWLKATQPLAGLSHMMTWIPTVDPWFVRSLGVAEMLGAIGLILPSLTRIQPKLTVAAAICLLVLQALAVSLHISRGEANMLGLNAVLIALLAFTLWGRTMMAVIAPR